MLSGCIPVAIGAAGVLATTSIIEERGITGTISDSAIRTGVNSSFAKNAPKLLSRLSTLVREGRVLLVGRVENEDMKKEAVRLTWNVSGVSEVLDRVEVGAAPPKTSGYVSDSWISSKISPQLLTSSRVQSINYTIKTFEGVVYIMGLARHQQELDDVIKIARESNGVKKVVSYVRVRDKDPLTKATNKPPSPTSSDGGEEGSSKAPQKPSSQNGLEPVALGPEPSKVESRG